MKPTVLIHPVPHRATFAGAASTPSSARFRLTVVTVDDVIAQDAAGRSGKTITLLPPESAPTPAIRTLAATPSAGLVRRRM